MYKLLYSIEARKQLESLKRRGVILKLRKIKATLDKLQENPRHPGLHTHKYQSLEYDDCDVFQSYVENRTPGAYRVFWCYGPEKEQITIIAITPHP